MTEQKPLTTRAAFKRWHREEAFYREVYTRMWGGVIAVVVVAIVASAVGIISSKPSIVALVLVVVVAIVFLLRSLLSDFRRFRYALASGDPRGLVLPIIRRSLLVVVLFSVIGLVKLLND